MQDGDTIIDSSTTDNDVLTAVVNSSATESRIQNIETLNIIGNLIDTGFNLINTMGTKVANFSTNYAGGTATIQGANSLNAAKIVAGANIDTLAVTSLSSGTRDTVIVDAGNAADVALTGSTAADSYDLSVTENAKVTLGLNYNTSADKLTLNLAGGDKNQLTTGTNTELQLIINADKENAVVDLTNATAQAAKSIEVTGSKDVTIQTATGASLIGTGVPTTGGVESVVKTGTGTATIQITGLADTLVNLESSAVDYVELGKDSAVNGAGTALTINEGAVLRLAGNTAAAALTVEVDNGHKDKKMPGSTGDGKAVGTAKVELAQTQGTGQDLKTGVKVKSLFLTVKHDEDKDLDKDNNGEKESHIKIDKITAADTNTSAVVIGGEESLSVTSAITFANGSGSGKYVVAANSLTGNLNIASIAAGNAADKVTFETAQGGTTANLGTGVFDVQLKGTSSTINLSGVADGTKVTATSGNNTITSKAGSSATNNITISLADGADTVYAAKFNAITLGGGSDTVVAGISAVDKTTIVKDFAKGVDTLRLTGTATDDVDVTNVKYGTTDGELEVGKAGDWKITLENAGTKLSATDLRDSIQLAGGFTAANGKSVIAGDKNDSINVAANQSATITTGNGSDTVILAAGSTTATTATVKDFTVDSDKIVVTGAIADDESVNLANVVRDSQGKYTLGTSTAGASFKLENDAKDIITRDVLTNIVQLGTSATTTFNVRDNTDNDKDVVVTGGKFDDFVKLTGKDAITNRAIYNFSNEGGVDTVVFGTTGTLDGRELVNFNLLDNIDSREAVEFLAAGAAKVGDATNNGVYIFADSSNGTGGAKITTMVTHTANGYTKDAITAEVAQFINAGMSTSTGENYVVIINDKSTETYLGKDWGGKDGGTYNYDAYAYLVKGNDSGVTAADITLIGRLDDADGTAGNTVFTDKVISTREGAGINILTTSAAAFNTADGTGIVGNSTVDAAGNIINIAAAAHLAGSTLKGGAGKDTVKFVASADYDLSGLTSFAQIENIDMTNIAASLTMKVAQHQSLEAITNASGKKVILSDVGTVTALAGVESYEFDATGNSSFIANTNDVSVTGKAATDVITVTNLNTDGQSFTGTTAKFVVTAGAANQTITTGAADDIIFAGKGSAIDTKAGNDQIRYLDLPTSTADSIAGFSSSDKFVFSHAKFAVAGLTSAAAGDVSSAAVNGTALNATDYKELNTSLASTGDIGDLSSVNVFVLGETAGIFASSTEAISAVKTHNTNGNNVTDTAMLVVYATAAGQYRISYDTNGADAGGETVVAELTGITDGAALLAAFGEASFAFGV